MGALSVKEWAKPIIKGLQEPAKRQTKSRKKGAKSPQKAGKKGRTEKIMKKL